MAAVEQKKTLDKKAEPVENPGLASYLLASRPSWLRSSSGSTP